MYVHCLVLGRRTRLSSYELLSKLLKVELHRHGIIWRSSIAVIKGDTERLDYSSYDSHRVATLGVEKTKLLLLDRWDRRV